MTKIALLGFGTVGRGLYNILKEKKELLNSLDINIEISKILVRNISKLSLIHISEPTRPLF